MKMLRNIKGREVLLIVVGMPVPLFFIFHLVRIFIEP